MHALHKKEKDFVKLVLQEKTFELRYDKRTHITKNFMKGWFVQPNKINFLDKDSSSQKINVNNIYGWFTSIKI